MQRRSFVQALSAASAVGLGTSMGAWPLVSRADTRVVRFGQSASLTGGQATYGQDMRNGIAAAFMAANTQNNGVRFELNCLDDGGLRATCMKNVLSLAETDTLALIGLTSGVGAEASLPVFEDSRIALLGTASGNLGLRGNNVKNVYNVRVGHDAEYRRMIGYAKDFGLKGVGIVYMGDAAASNLNALKQALADVNMSPKVAVAIDRNASNFEAAARELLASRPDCVMFTTNAEPIAKIIELMSAAKYSGLYYASSYSGQTLIDKLVARQQGCVMSLVVPRPSSMGTPVVNQCQRDLALLNNGTRLGVTTLEGYIVGRIAVEATHSAINSGRLSRARFGDVLAGLRTDLGGFRVDFGGGTQGSKFVDLMAVDRYGRLVG
ncbi:MAG TPA: ABC transporter substrate-binding protein [Ideonella sp.]|uniref:ABC transporter substrate-binding protein n=1 Tax=Ideonella sp. TaxID=1929293 RepID=UPI002E357D25|nr:ABC transporter substrate-binding protein [Ideonella sp.]HEX5683468.1 ABC transporter substrate-binding protein [Ideonella sp.]